MQNFIYSFVLSATYEKKTSGDQGSNIIGKRSFTETEIKQR